MKLQWNDSDALSVAPQRRFHVAMTDESGRTTAVTVTAGSIETVIDQVRGRRIVCPVGVFEASITELGKEE